MAGKKNAETKNGEGGDQVSYLGAVSIGVGGMVGGGIFAVLGLAVELGGGGVPVSFVVAGIVALLTAYAYARLSVAFPSQGGTVIFIDKAFGIDFMTGSANSLLWISYIFTLSLYAVAFGNYGITFFPQSMQGPFARHALISLAIVLPAALNLFSSRLISHAETYIVALKIIILLLVAGAGIGNIQTARLSAHAWKPMFQVIGGGMIIFVAYEGFELIANTAENVTDYKKNLPRAYYTAVGFVIALYVLISIVTVGSIPPDQIARVKDFALAEAAKPSLGDLGFTLVAVSAVLATLSAINATIYGAARLSYVIATEGELPPILEERIWHRPMVGLLVTAGAALVLSNLVDLSSISTMASAGFLLIFMLINVAAYVMSQKIGSSKIIAAAGAAACLGALSALCARTFQTRPLNLLVLAGMIGIAMGIEGIYIFFWKRPGKKARVEPQKNKPEPF